MIVVATRSRSRADDAAARAASLGRRYARLHLKLSDRIGRWKYSDLSKLSFVIVDTVEREVVIGWSRAVNHQHRASGFAEASRLSRGTDGVASCFEIAATANHPNKGTRHTRSKRSQQSKVPLRDR